MFRSSTTRVVLIVVAAFALLGILRYKPWLRGGGRPGAVTNGSATGVSEPARGKLSVGFLPVT